MSNPFPTFRLNNGVKIPALGFGTFANEGRGVMEKAVATALDAGYRHLDGAWDYENEDEVGSGIRLFLSRNPSVQREDIFITTKLPPHLMEPEDVEWSLNYSLNKLRLDYVDCFLIHWPYACERTEKYDYKEDEHKKCIMKKELTENLEPTWRAMEKLYKAGKAKSIGVSNMSIGRLEKLLKYAKVKPAVNQFEVHPFFPNNDLIKYCLLHDILPVGYSPLGSQAIAGKPAQEQVLNSEELKAIAAKKGVTLAQLLISWGIKRGYAVIPKSGNEERIKSNFKVFDLSTGEFEAVNKVSEGKNLRFIDLKEQFRYDVFSD